MTGGLIRPRRSRWCRGRRGLGARGGSRAPPEATLRRNRPPRGATRARASIPASSLDPRPLSLHGSLPPHRPSGGRPMLALRVIPCLDVKDGRVVKGVNFVALRDAGDPVEQARTYDREGADEVTFLDIAASHENRD